MNGIRMFLRAWCLLVLAMVFSTVAKAVYTFTGNVSVDYTFFTQNTLVDGFTINSGATVTWNTTEIVTGHIYIYSGGVLNISATNVLTIRNTTWNTTGISNAGTITVDAGALLNIDNGAGSTNRTQGIANYGIVSIYGAMHVGSQGDVLSMGFYNSSSGSLTISGESSFVSILNSQGIGILNDQGLISLMNGAKVYVQNSSTASEYSVGIANTKNIYIQDSELWIQNSGGYGLCNGNGFGNAQVSVSSIATINQPVRLGKLVVANTGGAGIWNGVIAGAGIFYPGFGGKILVIYGADLRLENAFGIGILNSASNSTITIGNSSDIAYMTINSTGSVALSSLVGTVIFTQNTFASYNQGTISGSVTKNGLPYLINNIAISDNGAYSPADYLPGFYVADGVTVTWTSQQSLSGAITIESGGTVVGDLTRNGVPYLLANKTITNPINPINYTNGFYIGGNAEINWNCNAAAHRISGLVSVESGKLNINNTAGIGLRLIGQLSLSSGTTLNINNSAGVGLYSRGAVNSMSGSTVNIQNSGGIGCYNFNTVAMANGTTNIKNSGGIGFINRGSVHATGNREIKIQHTGLYGFYNSASSGFLSCSGTASINIINSRGFGLVSKSPILMQGTGAITANSTGGRAFVDRSS